jgi:hypothetical protein
MDEGAWVTKIDARAESRGSGHAGGCDHLSGLGFGVWSLEFGVWGAVFGVWGLGFGVHGVGFVFFGSAFRVWGLGFGVEGLVLRV